MSSDHKPEPGEGVRFKAPKVDRCDWQRVATIVPPATYEALKARCPDGEIAPLLRKLVQDFVARTKRLPRE